MFRNQRTHRQSPYSPREVAGEHGPGFQRHAVLVHAMGIPERRHCGFFLKSVPRNPRSRDCRGSEPGRSYTRLALRTSPSIPSAVRNIGRPAGSGTAVAPGSTVEGATCRTLREVTEKLIEPVLLRYPPSRIIPVAPRSILCSSAIENPKDGSTPISSSAWSWKAKRSFVPESLKNTVKSSFAPNGLSSTARISIDPNGLEIGLSAVSVDMVRVREPKVNDAARVSGNSDRAMA